MDELESALQAWGRRWREGQGAFDPAQLSPAVPYYRARLRARWPSLGLAGAAAFLILTVAITRIGPNASVGWLDDGDRVVGTGFLIESPSGAVQLCIGGFGRGANSPGCSVVAVAVTAVDWDLVPGATRAEGIWYAEDVEVRGSWTESALQLESVTSHPRPSYTPPSNPCSADEGDGTGLETAEEEAALAALGSEVFGNPERYAGLWRAASRDNLGRVVVAVVEDPNELRPKLGTLYPFPLCVIRAEFSGADLSTALSSLGESTPDWLARLDYPTNRVIVSVGVITEAIQAKLQPFADRVFVRELLRPA